MADVAVPAIETLTPAAGDTVLGVQGGLVKRFGVGTGTGLAREVDLANDSDPAKGAALVGFSRPEPGAAGRSAREKLLEAPTPEDFGAVGDGVADDTAAVSSAAVAFNTYYTELESPELGHHQRNLILQAPPRTHSYFRIVQKPLTPPAAFGWTPDILPLYTGNRWAGSVSALSLFPASAGSDYYVDPLNGSDAAAGTSVAPLRTVLAALQKADVGVVYVAPATNASSDDGTWGNPTVTTTATHVIVRPWRIRPGRPTVTNRWQHYQSNWTVDGSFNRVWTATRTSVTGVWDFSRATPVRYESVASIASCQNRPGSYYYDGTNLSVHTYDSRQPDRALSIFIGNTCLYWNSTKSLYVQGIDAIGGIHSVWVPNTSASVIMVDVRAGFTSGNSFTFESSGTVILERCEAMYAELDGFNYHLSATYGAGKFIEIGCKSSNIGWGGTSTQSSTCHDGSTGVRIGCQYGDSWTQSVADVSAGTKTWNVGVLLGASRNYAGNSVGVYVSEATAWLYECELGDNQYDITTATGGSVYLHNTYAREYAGTNISHYVQA